MEKQRGTKAVTMTTMTGSDQGGGSSWEKVRDEKRGGCCGELGRDSGRY